MAACEEHGPACKSVDYKTRGIKKGRCWFGKTKKGDSNGTLCCRRNAYSYHCSDYRKNVSRMCTSFKK